MGKLISGVFQLLFIGVAIYAPWWVFYKITGGTKYIGEPDLMYAVIIGLILTPFMIMSAYKNSGQYEADLIGEAVADAVDDKIQEKQATQNIKDTKIAELEKEKKILELEKELETLKKGA